MNSQSDKRHAELHPFDAWLDETRPAWRAKNQGSVHYYAMRSAWLACESFTRSHVAHTPLPGPHDPSIPQWVHEELKDGDRICEAAGVQRTEGGRLPVQKIINRLASVPSTTPQKPLAPHHPDAEVRRMFRAWLIEPASGPTSWEDCYLAGFRQANKVEYAAVSATRDRRPWNQQDADMLAAAVDDAIRRGALDPRSQIADCRLDYGRPFSPEEVAAHLAKRRHGKNAANNSPDGGKQT